MSRIRDVPLRGIPPTKIAASRGGPLTAASCGSRRGGVALSAGQHDEEARLPRCSRAALELDCPKSLSEQPG